MSSFVISWDFCHTKLSVATSPFVVRSAQLKLSPTASLFIHSKLSPTAILFVVSKLSSLVSLFIVSKSSLAASLFAVSPKTSIFVATSPKALNTPSATKPPKQYQQHLYNLHQLDWYIKEIDQKYETSYLWGDFIFDVCGWGNLHPNDPHLKHPPSTPSRLFQWKRDTSHHLQLTMDAREGYNGPQMRPHSLSIKGIEFLWK